MCIFTFLIRSGYYFILFINIFIRVNIVSFQFHNYANLTSKQFIVNDFCTYLCINFAIGECFGGVLHLLTICFAFILLLYTKITDTLCFQTQSCYNSGLSHTFQIPVKRLSITSKFGKNKPA